MCARRLANSCGNKASSWLPTSSTTRPSGNTVMEWGRSAMVGLRLGDLSLGAIADQLRPDQVPVVWAKVATGYSAIGGALDGDAVRRTRAAVCIAMLPLTNLGITRHPRALSQLAHGKCAWAR